MLRDFVRNGGVVVTFDAQHCPQDVHFPDIGEASFFLRALRLEWQPGIR